MKRILPLALLLLPLPAGAVTPLFADNPEQLSRLHCQLLLHSTKNTTHPLDDRTLEHMLGRKTSGTNILSALRYITGGMPDMEFIIGKRWEVAPLDVRKRFDERFAIYLSEENQLTAPNTPEEYSKTCLMDVRITERTLDASATAKDLKPEERAYSAIAKTSLPASPSPLPVIYTLEKEPGYGWQIMELQLGDQKLVQTYSNDLNERIARGDFDEMISVIGD